MLGLRNARFFAWPRANSHGFSGRWDRFRTKLAFADENLASAMKSEDDVD